MRSAASIDRQPRGVVALGVVAGVALGLLPPGVARAAEDTRIWDSGHRLSLQARAELQRHLTAAERKGGVPIFLLITEGRHGEPVAEAAATAFAAQGLGRDPARNAVLLAVAVRSGEAAVETGKGSAGIVPELDGRRIAKQLGARLSSQHPEAAIAPAIAALAASARATATRRTPLPRDPLDEPTDDRPPPAPGDGAGTGVSDAGAPASDASPAEEGQDAGPAELGAFSDGGADGGLVPGALPGAATGGGRSRLPVAVAIAALVVVALGLRRRKQLASSRPPPPLDRPRRF